MSDRFDHAAEAVRAPFKFTNEQWREYQQIPDQGYSHRAHLESVFNGWLASRLTREKIIDVCEQELSASYVDPLDPRAEGVIEDAVKCADAILRLIGGDDE